MIYDVYVFTCEDSILVYGYFLLGLLIPLLLFDIKTKEIHSYRIVMKLGNFKKILDVVFPNRIVEFGEIKNKYEKEYYDLNTIKTGIYHLYDYYIKINYLKMMNILPSNTLVITGYDIFYDTMYQYTKEKLNVSRNRFVVLMEKYLTFYYTNDVKYRLTRIEKEERKIYYYKFINNLLINNKSLFINYLNKITQNIKITNKKILYIKRKKQTEYIDNFEGGGIRFIYNDKEFEKELLKNLDVNIVYLEDYNFLEQYVLIKSSKIIVGLHGSGLTNIIFMDKDSLVIEISGVINIDSYIFRNIANTFGLKYEHIAQKQMTYEESMKYFNNLTYKSKEIKTKVFDEINEYFTGTKYQNLNGYEKMFYPKCIQTIQNSGIIDVNQVIKTINNFLL